MLPIRYNPFKSPVFMIVFVLMLVVMTAFAGVSFDPSVVHAAGTPTPPTPQQCWDETYWPLWNWWVQQGWCPVETNPYKTWRW